MVRIKPLNPLLIKTEAWTFHQDKQKELPTISNVKCFGNRFSMGYGPSIRYNIEEMFAEGYEFLSSAQWMDLMIEEANKNRELRTNHNHNALIDSTARSFPQKFTAIRSQLSLEETFEVMKKVQNISETSNGIDEDFNLRSKEYFFASIVLENQEGLRILSEQTSQEFIRQNAHKFDDLILGNIEVNPDKFEGDGIYISSDNIRKTRQDPVKSIKRNHTTQLWLHLANNDQDRRIQFVDTTLNTYGYLPKLFKKEKMEIEVANRFFMQYCEASTDTRTIARIFSSRDTNTSIQAQGRGLTSYDSRNAYLLGVKPGNSIPK